MERLLVNGKSDKRGLFRLAEAKWEPSLADVNYKSAFGVGESMLGEFLYMYT